MVPPSIRVKKDSNPTIKNNHQICNLTTVPFCKLNSYYSTGPYPFPAPLPEAYAQKGRWLALRIRIGFIVLLQLCHLAFIHQLL